jgi:GTPase SAR1 family protein
LERADAYVVIFSVVDKASFSKAEQILTLLQDNDLVRSRGVILVANKIDLARSRAVSSQGKSFVVELDFVKICSTFLLLKF